MHAPTRQCLSDCRAHRKGRRGMSILEFVGCFTALVGGVVLGSMYLGVDVKEMAYTALERAEVIDPRPNPETPAATLSEIPAPTATGATVTPATTASTTPTTAETTPVASTGVTSTTESTPVAPAAEATAPTPLAPPAGLFAREDLITDEQRQALTLAYWQALNACMQDEVTHRVPAIDAEGNWQLFDYLTGRKDGHLKAAAAITLLDPRGVDDHVLAYSKTAQAWHEDGGKLFGRAVSLLTDAPTAQLSGPFAQSWQSASTQHRMEARLLVEKQQAVDTYLNHAYQAAPVATAAPAAVATP